MKAKAAIRLTMRSERQLEAMVDALTPEVERQVGTRSKVTLSSEKTTLVLSVEAEDTSALRAALNSYLRWANSALNVMESVTQEH